MKLVCFQCLQVVSKCSIWPKTMMQCVIATPHELASNAACWPDFIFEVSLALPTMKYIFKLSENGASDLWFSRTWTQRKRTSNTLASEKYFGVTLLKAMVPAVRNVPYKGLCRSCVQTSSQTINPRGQDRLKEIQDKITYCTISLPFRASVQLGIMWPCELNTWCKCQVIGRVILWHLLHTI